LSEAVLIVDRDRAAVRDRARNIAGADTVAEEGVRVSVLQFDRYADEADEGGAA
jgi:hypothetical protein